MAVNILFHKSFQNISLMFKMWTVLESVDYSVDGQKFEFSIEKFGND
jgi:hypothetical protein